MTRRTLAGRVALVQTGLTLAALALVIVGTWLALHVLLLRKTDQVLLETSRRAATLNGAFDPAHVDRAWLEDELAELRPTDVRVELRDASGRSFAASGPGSALGTAADGCRDRAELRVCTLRAEGATIVSAVDRAQEQRDAEQRVLLALLAVALTTAVIVSTVSRRIARRALGPLNALAACVAQSHPGAATPLPAQDSPFAELEGLRARFDELIVRYNEALAREKRLTAHAAHELRTPLGVARAEIDALEHPGELVAGRTRALTALDRLSALIDSLLWFARVQAPIELENMEVVNLADVVRAELRALEAQAAVRELACSLPDEALVRGDERLLSRVCANLIDNAIKYGDGERIEIRCEAVRERVRMCVINSGTLRHSATEQLFEPFFRGNERAPGDRGFGLGLPFARAVARALHGDLTFEAHAPGQTSFALTLPLVAWSGGRSF